MADPDEKEYHQIIIATVFIYLSVTGTVILFLIYYKYERFRSYGFQLVLMICFSDFLFCLPNLISYMLFFTVSGYTIGSFEPFCIFNGMMAVFSEQAIFLNAGLMIYILYKIIYKDQKIEEDSPIKYSLITYVYPLICSFVPFIFEEPEKAYIANRYGVSCYMKYGGWGMYLNIFFFIVPFVFIFFFEVVVVVLIFTKHYRQVILAQMRKERNFLIIYPTILVISWFYLVWTDISSDLGLYHEHKWSTYVSKFCFLDGFFNAIVLSLQLYKRKSEMVENKSQLSSEIEPRYEDKGLLSNNLRLNSAHNSQKENDSQFDSFLN